nr:anaerobic glycerol-3-phosphate dehydrogenase subunit GlpB [Desulforamulus aeronauticus]
MKKNTDVLVIGAGLSGLMAAAKAVAQHKKVLLVAKGMGALGLSSGCIDLWGYQINQPDKVCTNPLAEIAKLVSHKPEHPYAKVADVLPESIDFFLQICHQNKISYLNTNRNWQLPTALGTLRPTYLVPQSMAVPDLAEVKELLVVGFQALKDFYPDVLITNLQKNTPLGAHCHLKTLMVKLANQELNANTLAHLLEKQAMLEQVISQIKPHVLPGMVVLFPPVLGEQLGHEVTEVLSEKLGCSVYEVANIPPALPGQRLQKALLHHLKTQGVEVIIGCQVTDAQITEKRCQGVVANSNGKIMEISAQTMVLATGSFLGGGLTSQSNEIKEAVFGLPVKVCPGKWSRQDFLSLAGQPFHEFGVAVNDQLQPLDDQGQVLLENVLITGANLAGCNYPIEKCGNGVALASGYKAGKLVGEAGR